MKKDYHRERRTESALAEGLSPKQARVVAWQAAIDESLCLSVGAVRSGKTHASVRAFVEWTRLPEHSDKLHLICAQSLNVIRNDIMVMILKYIEGQNNCFTAQLSVFNSELLIGFKRDNRSQAVDKKRPFTRYLAVAGDDEDTFRRLMGCTAHSMLFDELTLVPQSFFVGAVGRLSYEGSKAWLMCNPGPPRHWLKLDYIDRGLIDFYQTFTFEDNPWLQERVKERMRRLFIPGSVAYKRYILGEWVASEGAIYPEYHTFSLDSLDHFRNENKDFPTYDGLRIRRVTIGHDHGVNDPCVFQPVVELDYPIQHKGLNIRFIALPSLMFEHGDTSNTLTDREILDRYLRWQIETFGRSTRVRFVRDTSPVAANFSRELRRSAKRGRFNSFQIVSADNLNERDVLNGIRRLNGLLATGDLAIDETCKHLLDEIDGYEWNDRANREKPIDGNDHHCDALRYAAMKLGRAVFGPVRQRNLVDRN